MNIWCQLNFEVFVHWPIYPTWNRQGWEPIHKKYKENKSIKTQVTKEHNNGETTNTLLTCTWVSNIGSAKALVHFLSHSCPVASLKCVWWSPDTYCFCPNTFGHFLEKYESGQGQTVKTDQLIFQVQALGK